MKVLAISGSLRDDSHNTALLRAAAELLPGAEVEIYPALESLPPLREDRLDPRPDAVQQLWDAVASSDALLISTPEYNHSIPGQLKNALDWLSRPLAESPLKGMPAAVVGASTGMFGAVWAQAETRKVLGAIGARVLDEELPVGQAGQKFSGGALDDEEIREALAEHLAAFERHAAGETASTTA